MARTPTLFDPDAADSIIGRFVAGARAAAAGVGVVLSDGRLLLLSLVPMLVHVALFVGLLVWLTGHVAPDVAAALTHALGAGSADDDAWHTLLAGIVRVGVGVLGVVCAFLGSVFAANVVADPFFDALSERTEELFIGRTVGTPFSVRSVVSGIGRELLANVVRLTAWSAGALPLWLLSFTTLAVIAGPLSILWAWLFAAWEFLSRSLVRHAVHWSDRLRAVFANKAFFVGFGAGATLLSLMPFTSPFLVVAGTRVHLALAARGRVASRLTDDERARLVSMMKKKVIAP